MFEWNPSYSVHIASLDGQHQQLFRLAGKLQAAIGSGHSHQILTGLFDDLVRYTQVHFQHEERMMEQAGYPGLAVHRREHEALLCRVQKLQKEFEEGRVTMSFEVLHFLKNWLEKHILGTDQQYVPCLRERSVA